MLSSLPFADLALATRLETAEGRSNAAFVDARAQLEPASGAVWQQVAGAYAMFDGVGSPLTQTFALGLTQDVLPDDLEAIEQFFHDRGSDTLHEVSPLAGVELSALLVTFGYMPVEMTSVMFLPLAGIQFASDAVNPRLVVRQIDHREADVYADVCARGWSDTPEVRAFIDNIARVSLARAGGPCVVAELDRVPVATGALFFWEGVALLAGASTVPEGRRQGAQRALLAARLQMAVERGCDLAMMCAAPGSASQRNAERNGFRIAYTRTKWQRS
jgi:GNAT superfamily N-acetyltransferase